jgi:SAM-dependent methyltransferase
VSDALSIASPKETTVAFLIDSPISEENLLRLVEFLDLRPDETVLDIGCGKGTFLARLCAHSRCSGVGVDADSNQIETAHEQIRDRYPVELVQADIKDFRTEQKFDLVACLGIWNGFPGLDLMRRFLKRTGRILLGTPFWLRDPDEAYRTGFGLDDSERGFRTAAGMVDQFYNEGYEVLYTFVSSKQEMDYYQSLQWNRREYADIHASHASKLNYFTWIREYWGWSVWILRNDHPAA